MQWETRYVRRVKWLWYICEGWTVDPMEEHQSGRWMLASRRIWP